VQGIQAISDANGWAMAITGAIIVFSGLTILATIISQLHKVIDLFEGKKKQKNKNTKLDKHAKSPGSNKLGLDIHDIASVYKPLAEQLGQAFQLADLYRLASKRDIIHPHISITRLRNANFLTPGENGLFAWNQN
jgi:hypothetical protein